MYIIFVNKHLNILLKTLTNPKNFKIIKKKYLIMKHLTTPISDEDLTKLKLGDQITISGTIYTGRDAALPQFVELIKQGKVPFDVNGMVIMHTAFSDAGPGSMEKEIS